MNASPLRRVFMSLLLGLCVAGPAAAQDLRGRPLLRHTGRQPDGRPGSLAGRSPVRNAGDRWRLSARIDLLADARRLGRLPTLLTLHSFTGPDGASPHSTLIFGADGNLYGTTPKGGGTDSGTAFRITPSGAFTRLHDFADGGGKSPSELVLASDGAFYGTASEGGAHDGGTIFRIGTDEVFSTVHDFDGAVEGTAPLGGLLEADGHLWGTTSLGGTAGLGTVFRLDLPATVVTVHEFQGTDGATPAAALIRALDGLLYGTTRAGGALNAGTVSASDELGTLTTLKSFDASSGDTPVAPLFEASDGKFYGTTSSGGPGGGKDDFPAGTVFRIDTAGTFERLYAFNAGLLGMLPAAARSEDSRMAATGSSMGRPRESTAPSTGSASQEPSPIPSFSRASATAKGSALRSARRRKRTGPSTEWPSPGTVASSFASTAPSRRSSISSRTRWR